MNSPFRLALLFLVLVCTGASAEPQPAPPVSLNPRHKTLLQNHCEKCHGAEKQKGKFRVDDLSLSISNLPTAERWQKILNALNSGEMPPEEEKPVPAALKTDFLDDLSNTMVSARRSLSDQQGVITMRRLNRREYRNTLHELLGADLNVTELPADTAAPGPEVVFDTLGSNLFMSSNQIEQYLSLAKEALEDAFERHAALGSTQKLHVEAEESLPRIQKDVQAERDGFERWKRWAAAVEEAATRPEVSGFVEHILKGKKDDKLLRLSWDKIPGAPSPEDFGFKRPEGPEWARLIADQAEVYKHWSTFFPYYDFYLSKPHLDTGAYFSAPVFRGSSNLIIFAFPSRFYITIPGQWPAGDYVVRYRIAATEHARPEQRFVEFGIGRAFQDERWEAKSTHEITGTMDAPQILEIPVSIRKLSDSNDRTFFIREKGTYYRYDVTTARERSLKRFEEGVALNGAGPEFPLWIDWLEVERKPTAPENAAPGLKALATVSLDDKGPAPTPEQLRTALERFTTEAFRGTAPRSTFIEGLLKMYDSYRTEGKKHSEALKETLAIVLSSPPFLYLAEPLADQPQRPLSQPELATRLSYFLWGAPPDHTLLDLAQRGELASPEVLAAQTERLIHDPRFEGFLRPFFQQWLSLDRLDFFKFSRSLFPHFDDGTEVAARNEIHETIAYLFRTNSSLRHLLKSDYIVINNVLANYYGIPDVKGDAFRPVSVPQGIPRGGLIGMAAILAMGGNGEHTSPVERGAWVLRKLLNEPPPPAPPNVPQLNRLAEKVLTPRERVRAHQEEPQCASCHRKIDPVGFGLENFDAVGQWRTEDTYQAIDKAGKPIPKAVKSWTIEPAGALHKGPAFNTFFELRDIIASRSEPFARGFSAALIQYALGRPCGFSDEPLVRSLVEQAQQKDFAIREFLHALIASKEFHTK